MSTRRYSFTLAGITFVLFFLSQFYIDRPYSPAAFWEAKLEGDELNRQPYEAEEPVPTIAHWPTPLAQKPAAVVPEEAHRPISIPSLDIPIEASEEDIVADEDPFSPVEEEVKSATTLHATEHIIQRRLPTFHVLTPPRPILRSIAECAARCRSPRGRLARRDAEEDARQYSKALDKAIDKAYGSAISFPIKGAFPYILRNTTQFSLKRVFDLRLSTLPRSSRTTVEKADYVYFSIDGEALRACEKCASQLHSPRPEVRIELQSWILEKSKQLKGRRSYPSMFLLLPRIWHAYSAGLLTEHTRSVLMSDGVVMNIELEKTLMGKKGMWQIPYPTMFHLPAGKEAQAAVRDWIVNQERPNLLACSLGRLDVLNTQSSIIRKAIAAQLSNLDREDLYFSFHYDPEEAYTAMSESKFCLQPPGDSATRRGFFDSVLLGCIPVIFQSQIYHPFGSPSIAVEEFAYVISEKDAFSTSSPSKIMSILEKMSPQEIRRRQEGLAKMAPHLQYALPGQDYKLEDDAFMRIMNSLAELRDEAEDSI